jgi:hypothetical protein
LSVIADVLEKEGTRKREVKPTVNLKNFNKEGQSIINTENSVAFKVQQRTGKCK